MRVSSVPRRGPVPRYRARGLTLALLPVLLAACTAGPSTRPPVVEADGGEPVGSSRSAAPPSGPLPLPELEESESELDWAGCEEETRERLGEPAVPDTLRFSCATLTASLDAPELPGRGITRLAVLKVGDGPVPLAVVNDIGGLPGTLYAARLATRLPDELLDRFSLIGMDRRGTGLSDAARCIPGDIRRALLGHDPAENSGPLLDAARMAGQQCAITLEEQQRALDSWRAAGDLEALRSRLRVPRLNALAHGEGSKVLARYAMRFPGKVGRVVLDGLPDPSDDRAAVLEGIAAGAESTLAAFGEDCVERGGCPLPTDATDAVTTLVEQVRRTPLTPGSDVRMGPALALRAVHAGIAHRERWPELADAITAALRGSGAALFAFVEPQLLETRASPARLDGSLATRCNDSTARLPADRLDRTIAELDAEHPVFGALLAQELVWCSPWPSRSEPLPTAGPRATPPILVLSTATDPVTPEQGTIRAAEQLPTAVRVAWQGAGHGALASPCVAELVSRFLVGGEVPRDGTLCPA